jgi:ketosteroid isomerase-like protein
MLAICCGLLQAWVLVPTVLRPHHLDLRVRNPRLSASSEGNVVSLEKLKRDLAAAVAAENYPVAANLRDQLEAAQLDDGAAILAANAEFYAAFEAGDHKRMGDVWADGSDIMCAHPGSAPLYGHEEIMQSWREILSDGGQPIRADRVHCTRLGTSSAAVSCIEQLGSGGTGSGNGIVATNLFAKQEGGSWRMVLHQAGPIVQ